MRGSGTRLGYVQREQEATKLLLLEKVKLHSSRCVVLATATEINLLRDVRSYIADNIIEQIVDVGWLHVSNTCTNAPEYQNYSVRRLRHLHYLE